MVLLKFKISARESVSCGIGAKGGWNEKDEPCPQSDWLAFTQRLAASIAESVLYLYLGSLYPEDIKGLCNLSNRL